MSRPNTGNDVRFEGQSLVELREMLQVLMADGPPSDKSDADFLRAVAHEIGLREKQVQSGQRTEYD